ncbi:F-box/WD repeat-containing protein 7 [Taenia solium]|eukprot:TsM_000992800 transcript=TsM_000992800 gene=TsM_000992800
MLYNYPSTDKHMSPTTITNQFVASSGDDRCANLWGRETSRTIRDIIRLRKPGVLNWRVAITESSQDLACALGARNDLELQPQFLVFDFFDDGSHVGQHRAAATTRPADSLFEAEISCDNSLSSTVA